MSVASEYSSTPGRCRRASRHRDVAPSGGWYGRMLQRMLRPDDGMDERQRKLVAAPLLLSLGFTSLVWTGYSIHSIGVTVVNVVLALNAVQDFALLASTLYTRRLSRLRLNLLLLWMLVAVMTLDWDGAGQAVFWPIFVLIFDVLWLVRSGEGFARALLVLAVIWGIVRTMEVHLRFGMDDFYYRHFRPGTEFSDENWERVGCNTSTPIEQRRGTRCDPDGVPLTPPTSILWLLAQGTVLLVVLILDFSLTRGFALGMRAETRKVQETVRVAEEVAAALVLFDLSEAERLATSSSITPELQNAFRDMIANLRQYRPYLPDSLFDDGLSDDTSDECSFSSPLRESAAASPFQREAPQGDVAIVFTDIEGSTLLWERGDVVMSAALIQHDSVMRRCIQEHDGYEVKTIGDAFMVAFDTATNAAHFCIDAQMELLTQVWQKEILQARGCNPANDPSGTQIWGGLRVRMGIHAGPAMPRQNPITGRADYFGPTVNKAARVEAAVTGGLIALSQPTVDALDLMKLGSPLVFSLGEVPLSGINEPMRLSGMLPRQLAARRAEVGLRKPKQRISIREPMPSAAARLRDVDSMSFQSSDDEPADRAVVGLVGLRRTMSTVANTRIANAGFLCASECTKLVNTMLVYCDESAASTQGTIVSVCGHSVLTAWNTSKPCLPHGVQGTRFACFVSARVGDTSREDSLRCTVGVATGPTFNGNVGSVRRRFVSVVGASVELSVALSETATVYAATALVAETGPYGYCAAFTDLRHLCRPIDVWRIGIAPPCTVVVYELRTAAGDSRWGLQDDEDASWNTGEELGKALHVPTSARQAFVFQPPDAAALTRLSESRPADTVLATIAAIALRGGHARALCYALLHADDCVTQVPPCVEPPVQRGATGSQMSCGSRMSLLRWDTPLREARTPPLRTDEDKEGFAWEQARSCVPKLPGD